MTRNTTTHSYGYDDGVDENLRDYAREADALKHSVQKDVKQGISEFAQEARDIAEAQERGQAMPDYKFLGIISMPAMAGAALKTIVNPLLGKAGVFVQRHAGTIIENQGARFIADAGKRQVVARSAGLTIGAATLLSDNVTELWRNVGGYRKDAAQLADSIAPVLQDIKGGKGFAALLGVGPDDNEVIYAQRRRIGAKLTSNNMNNLIGVGAKVPGVLELLGVKLPGMSADGKGSSTLDIAAGGLGSLSEIYQDGLRRDQKRLNAKPSALTMITELAEQMKSGADAMDFEVPGSRRQVPLAQYIALTFKCHQEDMAKLDTGSSTIRKSLDGALMEASERLAQALQNNEISPLMLVRLVGERHIVKNSGRAVAPMKEVERAIRQFSGKNASYNVVPEKEFFEARPMQDIKEALTHLKGEERQLYMATVPDNILRKVGVSDKDIKTMRETTGAHYERLMAELAVGLAAEDDKALQARGISAEGIAEVRKTARDVAALGKAGVHKHLSTGGGNGLEDVMHDMVVESAKGDGPKHMVSAVLAEGKGLMAKAKREAADNNYLGAVNDNAERSHTGRVQRGHAGNEELGLQ